jgi:hypothetical protein
MMTKKSPILRTINKVKPPYSLNYFPKDFGMKIGKEIIYLLGTKFTPSLEGSEWEKIFANCINADWKPSNVGLDDIVLGNCAWAAKTVKANPETSKIIPLISGRNNIAYSYGIADYFNMDTNDLGEKVLTIWNERVSAIREKYKFLRSVILLKSNNLETVSVFEFDTVRYDPTLYYWEWREGRKKQTKNLFGYDKASDFHRFTWQPSGSQFTIRTNVTNRRLIVKVKNPGQFPKDKFFELINFDNSWVNVQVKE